MNKKNVFNFKVAALAIACIGSVSVAQAQAVAPSNAPAAPANKTQSPAPAVAPVQPAGQVAQQSAFKPLNVNQNPTPITPSAPQFIPAAQQPGTVPGPVVTPTVSAYGTPIYYDQNGVPQATPPVQQAVPVAGQPTQIQAANTPPTALPPLPVATVPQALEAGGLYLQPNQIRQLHKEVENMGRAAAEDPAGLPPRSATSSVKASLTPGSTPPVIRLYMNYPTSLVIVDNAGNPWPIENWAGGSSSIEIKRPVSKESPDSASITLTPRTATGKFTFGGLTLYLKDLAIPVSITYVGGQPIVDQRVEVRIPARGPNTTAPVSQGVGAAANPALLSLLDGVAPATAKPLKVPSGLAQAWSLGNNRMMVRTHLSVISPGYTSGMRSADGTNVYEMEQVSELRAMKDGKIVSISIDY